MAIQTAPIHGQWEINLSAEGTPSPLTEVLATFTSPSGRRAVVRGFWRGDANWTVRFMPTERGSWKYEIEADDQGLKATGTFACVGTRVHTPFGKHGPIERSAERYFLQHADGTPFFYLADTAWNGALLADEGDWHRYLKERAWAGFTAIQIVSHAPWLGCATAADGEVAFTGKPASPINPQFFERIDKWIDAINAHGMLAVPVLIWDAPSSGESWSPGTEMGIAPLIEVARHQVARFGANHVMWILAGDGSYFLWRAPRWRKIGRATFDGITHAPVSMHPRGLQWPYDKFADERWLGVAGFQSSHSTADDTLKFIHSGPPARAWSKAPARVTINLEPCYEDLLMSWHNNERVSAKNVRQAAYWSLLMAPTAGVTYGAHGIWSWQEIAAEPFNHAGMGVARPWFEAMQFPGADHMRILGEFFRSIEWWTLRPAPGLIAGPISTEPAQFIAAAKNTDGSLAVIYAPAGGRIALGESTLKAGLQASWCNPRTGERHRAAELVAPDNEDWLLLLNDQKSSTP